ncbi:MAG: hypothetical protein N3C63_07460 [Rhodocyclaceae bacterium]|nr:hypothetical protein [Rhodocyclaceae bacterium]
MAEHPDAIAAEPFRPEVRPPSAPLTGTERRRILSWLGWIGEVDRSVIALIDQCERDADARAYYLGRAAEAPEDDRRICLECRNLAGRRCLAAARGEIVASRNYEPIRDLPRRCEGYVPGPDDADRRPGRERWPGLIQKGGE